MPSGFFAKLIAPSPNRIGVKYVERQEIRRRAAGEEVVADPVEDRRRARERQAGEQRATRATDPEGDGEREPEQAGERGGGRVR